VAAAAARVEEQRSDQEHYDRGGWQEALHAGISTNGMLAFYSGAECSARGLRCAEFPLFSASFCKRRKVLAISPKEARIATITEFFELFG
jgi:hypothetical protein